MIGNCFFRFEIVANKSNGNLPVQIFPGLANLLQRCIVSFHHSRTHWHRLKMHIIHDCGASIDCQIVVLRDIAKSFSFFRFRLRFFLGWLTLSRHLGWFSQLEQYACNSHLALPHPYNLNLNNIAIPSRVFSGADAYIRWRKIELWSKQANETK